MAEGARIECKKCTENDKAARGCEGDKKWKVGKYEMDGCPGKLLTREFYFALELWARWKKFGWPYMGGWAEQPAVMFDIVEAFENEQISLDNERIKKTSGNSD